MDGLVGRIWIWPLEIRISARTNLEPRVRTGNNSGEVPPAPNTEGAVMITEAHPELDGNPSCAVCGAVMADPASVMLPGWWVCLSCGGTVPANKPAMSERAAKVLDIPSDLREDWDTATEALKHHKDDRRGMELRRVIELCERITRLTAELAESVAQTERWIAQANAYNVRLAEVENENARLKAPVSEKGAAEIPSEYLDNGEFFGLSWRQQVEALQRIGRLTAELAQAKAENKLLEVRIGEISSDAGIQAFVDSFEKVKAENARLKAPVGISEVEAQYGKPLSLEQQEKLLEYAGVATVIIASRAAGDGGGHE